MSPKVGQDKQKWIFKLNNSEKGGYRDENFKIII